MFQLLVFKDNTGPSVPHNIVSEALPHEHVKTSFSFFEKLKLPSLRKKKCTVALPTLQKTMHQHPTPSVMKMFTITILVSDSKITGNRWSLRKDLKTLIC